MNKHRNKAYMLFAILGMAIVVTCTGAFTKLNHNYRLENSLRLLKNENKNKSELNAERNRIIVYGISRSGADSFYIKFYEDDFSKLDNLALENGIMLDVYEEYADFLREVRYSSDIAGIIDVGGSLTWDEINSFLLKGGRVFRAYSVYSLGKNLGPNKNINMISGPGEFIMNSGQYQFPDDSLPPWLQGLAIGVINGDRSERLFLDSFLEVSGDDGDRGYLMDRKTSEEKLIYYGSPDGNLILFPIINSPYEVNGYYHIYWNVFFDDWNFSYYEFDNEEAALRMMHYLLGTYNE